MINVRMTRKEMEQMQKATAKASVSCSVEKWRSRNCEGAAPNSVRKANPPIYKRWRLYASVCIIGFATIILLVSKGADPFPFDIANAMPFAMDKAPNCSAEHAYLSLDQRLDDVR